MALAPSAMREIPVADNARRSTFTCNAKGTEVSIMALLRPQAAAPRQQARGDYYSLNRRRHFGLCRRRNRTVGLDAMAQGLEDAAEFPSPPSYSPGVRGHDDFC